MSFNQIKHLLANILEDLTVLDKLTSLEKPVTVLTEFPPGEYLPAVTMNSNGGGGHIETLTFKKMTPLPSDHPYFDPKAPETLYNTGNMIKHVFDGKLLLHVWSESNYERDIITEEVNLRLIRSKNKVLNMDSPVQIRNIGGRNDIDQFDSYPPLYHTTLEISFTYTVIDSVKSLPLCKIIKKKMV